MEGFLLPCLITREYIQILFSASVADSILSLKRQSSSPSQNLSLPCVSHWRITYIITGRFWVPCLSLKSQNSISMTRVSKSSNCGSTRKKMIFQGMFSEFFYLALTIGFLPMEWFFDVFRLSHLHVVVPTFSPKALPFYLGVFVNSPRKIEGPSQTEQHHMCDD